MILSLFRASERSPIPNQIYGNLVTAARDPDLYRKCGIEDSVMGRFDLLSLHVFLFSRCLREADVSGAQELSQEVFDLYVDGVEIALRELGIGDTSVPKRKKKMIHSFYGLVEDLDPPLKKDDLKAIETIVQKRFYQTENASGAAALASYISDNAKRLTNIETDRVFAGDFQFTSVLESADHV